jgi:hypothetical protein
VVWATLAAIALARHPSWLWAVVLGVLLGLGGSTKLSPMLIALPLAAMGVLLIASATRLCRPEAGRVSAVGWRLVPLPAVGGGGRRGELARRHLAARRD